MSNEVFTKSPGSSAGSSDSLQCFSQGHRAALLALLENVFPCLSTGFLGGTVGPRFEEVFACLSSGSLGGAAVAVWEGVCLFVLRVTQRRYWPCLRRRLPVCPQGHSAALLALFEEVFACLSSGPLSGAAGPVWGGVCLFVPRDTRRRCWPCLRRCLPVCPQGHSAALLALFEEVFVCLSSGPLGGAAGPVWGVCLSSGPLGGAAGTVWGGVCLFVLRATRRRCWPCLRRCLPGCQWAPSSTGVFWWCMAASRATPMFIGWRTLTDIRWDAERAAAQQPMTRLYGVLIKHGMRPLPFCVHCILYVHALYVGTGALWQVPGPDGVQSNNAVLGVI